MRTVGHKLTVLIEGGTMETLTIVTHPDGMATVTSDKYHIEMTDTLQAVLMFTLGYSRVGDTLKFQGCNMHTFERTE